jgi:hypothetical protein
MALRKHSQVGLPEHLSEQADEMLKSSYSLEFLGLRQAVKERELEDQLISRLQSFLLELGYRGAPAEDCEHLLERLCEWLNGPDFKPREGMDAV